MDSLKDYNSKDNFNLAQLKGKKISKTNSLICTQKDLLYVKHEYANLNI